MGGSIVGVHRHQGIAITMLLIHHVERAIALRDTSALLCALMDRMMSFPARLVQWCGYRAKSAKMTIDEVPEYSYQNYDDRGHRK